MDSSGELEVEKSMTESSSVLDNLGGFKHAAIGLSGFFCARKVKLRRQHFMGECQVQKKWKLQQPS